MLVLLLVCFYKHACSVTEKYFRIEKSRNKFRIFFIIKSLNDLFGFEEFQITVNIVDFIIFLKYVFTDFRQENLLLAKHIVTGKIFKISSKCGKTCQNKTEPVYNGIRYQTEHFHCSGATEIIHS